VLVVGVCVSLLRGDFESGLQPATLQQRELKRRNVARMIPSLGRASTCSTHTWTDQQQLQGTSCCSVVSSRSIFGLLPFFEWFWCFLVLVFVHLPSLPRSLFPSPSLPACPPSLPPSSSKSLEGRKRREEKTPPFSLNQIQIYAIRTKRD